MRWIRPQLGRIAGAWLVFQVCLLVSVPAAVCSTTLASTTVAARCTCGHDNGDTCPMHHPASVSKTPSSSCSCRSSSDPIAVLAAALIGPAAVLASPGPLIDPVNAAADL